MVVASPTVTPGQIPTESALPTTEDISAPPTLATPTEPPAVTPTAEISPVTVCTVGQPRTPADMEGPYFLAGSPEKTSLIEPGMTGTPLMINGYVMTVDCQPIPGAKLEFWQADADGVYDLQGYRLRGHVISDENGHYQIQTIIPAPYEPRPSHIHVMVLPPGGSGLTTQLYFPDDSPYPELTLALNEDSQGVTAVFNFVLARK
jgi:protocatechuate 3,4-dioxygenase beta subunit